MTENDGVHTLILGLHEAFAEFLDGTRGGDGDVFGVNELVVVRLAEDGNEDVG